jgi:iron complex transport system permease protein
LFQPQFDEKKSYINESDALNDGSNPHFCVVIRIIILSVLVCLLFCAELIFGSVPIALSELWNSLTGNEGVNRAHQIILINSRFPRALTALIGGSALSLSGLLMQTLFRNPLAGPSVLGISSGASLGVAVLVLATGGSLAGWGGYAAIASAAMLGALAVLFIVLAVSVKLNDNTTLLIFGIMLSFFTSAIVDALQFKSSNESLRSYVSWGMGSFAETNYSEIALVGSLTIGAVLLTLLILPRLNLLLLGDEYATSMGVNIKNTRFMLIIVTGILAGITTAFCGPVAFIGLAVPHLVRTTIRTSDHGRLILPVILCGSAVGLLCDLFARLLELPLNTIASALGAPVILFTLLSSSRSKAII